MRRSKRIETLDQRPVNLDGYINEWPEMGFVAMTSPYDPKPSVKVANGRIVELDGKKREDFDFIDQFIADYAMNVERAEASMAVSSLEIARMIVDIHVSRKEILELVTGITPALLKAFAGGADGIIVSGCHPNDCHYTSGNFHARRRWIVFRGLLDFLGIDVRRIRYSWVSAAEGAKWADLVNETVAGIRELGPYLEYQKASDYLEKEAIYE